MVPSIFRKIAQTYDTFRGKWPKTLQSFLLQRHFCHDNYLVLARTQLFHQLPCPKYPCICVVNVHREPSGTVWLLWPFWMCEIFCKQTLCWVQSFMGATIHKSWISRKFNPRNILPWKCQRLRYVLIAYTITTSTLHLTHKISIHSDKLCVVPYIDIDHLKLVMLPDHTLC